MHAYATPVCCKLRVGTPIQHESLSCVVLVNYLTKKHPFHRCLTDQSFGHKTPSREWNFVSTKRAWKDKKKEKDKKKKDWCITLLYVPRVRVSWNLGTSDWVAQIMTWCMVICHLGTSQFLQVVSMKQYPELPQHLLKTWILTSTSSSHIWKTVIGISYDFMYYVLSRHQKYQVPGFLQKLVS